MRKINLVPVTKEVLTDEESKAINGCSLTKTENYTYFADDDKTHIMKNQRGEWRVYVKDSYEYFQDINEAISHLKENLNK